MILCYVIVDKGGQNMTSIKTKKKKHEETLTIPTILLDVFAKYVPNRFNINQRTVKYFHKYETLVRCKLISKPATKKYVKSQFCYRTVNKQKSHAKVEDSFFFLTKYWRCIHTSYFLYKQMLFTVALLL